MFVHTNTHFNVKFTNDIMQLLKFFSCLTLDCVNRLAMVLLMLVTSISSYPSSDTPIVGGGAGTAGVGAGATGAAATAGFGTSGGGTEKKYNIIIKIEQNIIQKI